ncbi:hypothetical protein CPB83DRAFT_888761 [Crepidotus variabilis]|uniref:Uncharacterized protein n=1 Tax=Crepidotus variabilis TaxID=179855 RepID=A0A9P6JW79_9AGAR|nr:hypothetical protein CPB83DRAFT_888761 [Crepidotus variabilis]
MKPIAFLRNTWKKFDKSSESRDSPSPSGTSRATTRSPASFSSSLRVKVDRVTIEHIGRSSPVPVPPPKDNVSPFHATAPRDRPNHRQLRRVASVSSDTVSLADYPTYLQDPFNSISPSSIPSPSRPSPSPLSPNKTTPLNANGNTFRSNVNDASVTPPHIRPRKTSIQSLRQRHLRLPALDFLPLLELECPHTKDHNASTCSSCSTNAAWPMYGHRDEHSDQNADQSPKRTSPAAIPCSPTDCVFPTAVLSPTRSRGGFYQTLAGSSPHLPYNHNASTHSPQLDTSTHNQLRKDDVDTFPLSLFPSPPPLTIRKKRPSPLVIRPVESMSTLSSTDSTPVGTPTTPRFGPFIQPDSPSGSISSSSSLSRKTSFARSIAIFSPPPTSPPTSPLPDLPGQRSSHQNHSLKTANSCINLRQVSSPRRRLTSSEPIRHGGVPRTIQSPTRQQFSPHSTEMNPGKDIVQFRPRAPSAPAQVDAQVQWGYAF